MGYRPGLGRLVKPGLNTQYPGLNIEKKNNKKQNKKQQQQKKNNKTFGSRIQIRTQNGSNRSTCWKLTEYKSPQSMD